MNEELTYAEFINNIIKTRGQWSIKNDTYFEGHHITPRCLGGTGNTRKKDSNIIWLYPDEHYIAHKLLAIENPDNYRLQSAFSMMAFPKGKTNRCALTPEEYKEAREIFSAGISGDNNPMSGKKPWCFGLTKETDSRVATIALKLSQVKSGVKKGPDSEETRIRKSAAVRKRYAEHPETFKGRIKGKVSVNNGSICFYINKGDALPDGFTYGQGKHKSYHISDRDALHDIRSKQTSGSNNPMFGKGYKIAGGNNGKATKYYIFRGIRFDSRKELVLYLNTIDYKVSTSTIRKFEKGSERVKREHPILIDLVWGMK